MSSWPVTGGTGFLGSELLRRLAEIHSYSNACGESSRIFGTCRVLPLRSIAGIEYIALGDL